MFQLWDPIHAKIDLLIEPYPRMKYNDWDDDTPNDGSCDKLYDKRRPR